MQIKILSLTVKNCGALKNVKIDFTDNGQPQSVIVLGGANGSGKTTVLELIFTLSYLLSIPPRTQSLYDSKIEYFLEHTEYAEMELLIDEEKMSIFCSQHPLTHSPLNKNKHGLIREKINYARHDEILTSQYISKQQISDHIRQYESNLFISESNDYNIIPSILYFPHRRELLVSKKSEQIYREEVKYKWCYRYESLSSFQGSLESYLIWLDYAEPEIFQSVIDFLNQLDFEGKTFCIHRKTLSVMVKTRDGSEHPFNKLSSGEQNILIMLLELRRRLIPGSVVLLDEIENSLHPAFQHRLAQNLLQLQRQIPFQLILTTHQPVFVKIFGEKCTRILTEF
jgi:AAA15 family ATPase/GTPase